MGSLIFGNLTMEFPFRITVIHVKIFNIKFSISLNIINFNG